MTDKTPEALRLAGKLYDDGDVPSLEECSQAASLLRRQHQRIEELEQVLSKSLKLIDRDNRSTDRPNDYRLRFVAQARALLSTTQPREHQPGCDALGGYGHGVGQCSCALSTTQQEDSQA